jgi:hypothetical protein
MFFFFFGLGFTEAVSSEEKSVDGTIASDSTIKKRKRDEYNRYL